MRNVYRIWLKKLVTVFICMGLFVPFFGFAVTAEETINEVNPSQAPEQSDENSEANFNTSSDSSLDEERLTISISNLTGPAYVMENRVDDENPDLTNFQFQFKIECKELGGFDGNETITVNTNLGQWFDANWEALGEYPIYQSDGETILGIVSIGPDKISFQLKEASAQRTTFQGVVRIPANLSAKDTPEVTPDHFETREIFIDDAKCYVEFREERMPAGSGGEESSLWLPDVDQFWKTYYTINDSLGATNGATAYLQVNPIGSLDLYGSTTYYNEEKGGWRVPVKYTNYMVRDSLPANIHIDPESVSINAKINTIKMNTGKDHVNWHVDDLGAYDIPVGTYYAEGSSSTYRINDRLTKLTQNPGESYDAFYARIKFSQLQWGIYIDEDGKETFLCNLGNIGDPDNNNGILYEQFALGQTYVAQYPEIFGREGASGGNVVSYYITFNSYATEKAFQGALTLDVTNEGAYVADAAYRNETSLQYRWLGHGNTHTANVANRNTFAFVDSDDLTLQLVDEDFPDVPISAAGFKLQRLVDGQWQDTGFTGKTDSAGYYTFKSLVAGTYKLVQTSTKAGYYFGNNTYGSSEIEENKDLDVCGVFTVPEDNTSGYATIVTNYRKIDLGVTKVWDDDNNKDNIRPGSVNIEVLKNGNYLQNVVLNETNQWSASIENLRAYENQKPISYTVNEGNVPEGYSVAITGSAESGYVVTNTHKTATIDIPVSKIWEDDNDRDGLRPDNVTLQLYAGDSRVEGKAIDVSEATEWQGVFSDLPRFDGNNQEISYSVKELNCPDGYTVSITGDRESGFVVTNTHEIAKREIKVHKTWNDENDQDGIRPPAITIQLFKNEETEPYKSLYITAADQWEGTFNDLPVYENGEAIKYYIQEESIDGYTSDAISNKVEMTSTEIEVKNTHAPEKIALEITKNWDDKQNASGIRPDKIDVLISGSDGSKQTVSLQKTAEGDTLDTWVINVHLPKYKNGKIIVYTIEEVTVSGYESYINGNMGDGFVITNEIIEPLPDTGGHGDLYYVVPGVGLLIAGLLCMLKKEKMG